MTNWPKAALTLVNKSSNGPPGEAATALADEPTLAFKCGNDAALAASLAAYERALAFKCSTNCS